MWDSFWNLRMLMLLNVGYLLISLLLTALLLIQQEVKENLDVCIPNRQVVSEKTKIEKRDLFKNLFHHKYFLWAQSIILDHRHSLKKKASKKCSLKIGVLLLTCQLY